MRYPKILPVDSRWTISSGEGDSVVVLFSCGESLFWFCAPYAAASIGDFDELRIRHAAVLRHIRRMYEASSTYRGVLTIHSAHPDEEEGRHQRGHHDHQEQHHQTAHETRQTHADRLWIGGRAGVLYHHGGIVAGIRCAQRKIDVTRRDHLNDPRGIHVRHLLRRSFVHVGGEQGHRVIDILKIEDNRCNVGEFAS